MNSIWRTTSGVHALVLLVYLFWNVCGCWSVAILTEMSSADDPPPVLTDRLKYMGCYDVWKGNAIVSISKFAQDLSLEACTAYCNEKDQPPAPSDILLVRGMYCGCMSWTHFDLTRVTDDNCHIDCPTSPSTNEQFTCGGNYGFSLYCNNTGINAQLCDNFIYEPNIKVIESLIIETKDDDHQVSTTLTILPELLPIYPCFECKDYLECYWPMGPSFTYFPKNTPQLCLNFCRRDLMLDDEGVSVREKTTYAIVGWNNVDRIPIPICWCTNTMGSKFEEVEEEKCNKPCPANPDLSCGGAPLTFFAMYCSILHLCSDEPSVPTTVSTTESSTITTTEPTTVTTTEPTTVTTTEPTTVTTTEPTTVTTTEPTTVTTTEPTTVTTTEPTTVTTTEPTTVTTTEPTTVTTTEPTTVTTTEPTTVTTTEPTTESSTEHTTASTTEDTTTSLSTPTTSIPPVTPGFKYIGCYDAWRGNEDAVTHTFSDDLTLDTCAAFCKEREDETDLFVVRGMFCGCISWANFKHVQVVEKSCNLNCGNPRYRNNEICGGNHAVSLYCDPSSLGSNAQRCNEFQYVPTKDTVETVTVTSPSNPQIKPGKQSTVLPCFNCTNINDCIFPFSASYSYFPKNSPEICIEFCQRDVAVIGTNRVREGTTYAIVGWKSDGLPIPVCWCTDEILSNFVGVDIGVCNKLCPASPDKTCGGDPPYIFAMYCSKLDPDDPPTSPASTSTETSPATSTSLAISTTPEDTCSKKCEVLNDNNGQNWRACAGDTAVNDCPRSAKGQASWECSAGGTFIGTLPDYSKCSSLWQDEIDIGEGDVLEPEDAADIFDTIATAVSDNGAENVNYFGHEILFIMDTMTKVFDQLTRTVDLNIFENLTEKAVGINEKVLINKQPWKELPMTNRSILGTDLIRRTDVTIFELTTRATHSHTSAAVKSDDKFYRKFFKSQNVGVKLSSGAQSKSWTGDSTLRFPFEYDEYPDSKSYILLPSGWANLVDEDNLNFAGSAIASKFIQQIFQPNFNLETETGQSEDVFSKRINGKMMSFSLANTNNENSNQINFPGNGVTIRFEHDVVSSKTRIKDLPRRRHPDERPKPVYKSSACVFWDTENLEWSSVGCKLVSSNQSVTICECSHLTSFAVLMDMHNYLGKESALEILTLVLSPLSAICLLITIISYITFTSTKSSRTSITKYLCISLLAGNTSVLLILDRHYFNMSDGVCTGAAMVTHYIFLTAFAWMAVEGYHLYKMVVHVFDSGRSDMIVYRALSYGLPLVIVGATAASSFINDSEAYGGEMFCWLQGNYLWAFLAPVAIVVFGNTITLIITLKTAARVNGGNPTPQVQDRARANKKWVKGCLSLTVVLGLTWVVGFMVMTGSVTSVIAAYIFTVLNASQGILIFIFHCLLNEKVLTAARKRNLPIPSWLPSRKDTWLASRKDTPPVSKSRSGENLRTYLEKELEKEKRSEEPRPGYSGGTESRRRSQHYDPNATVSSLESFRTGTTYTSGNESSGSIFSLIRHPNNEYESEI